MRYAVLTQAYDLSDSLIRENSRMFSESNSFLDFLFKICNADDRPMSRIDSMDGIKKQLDDCLDSKNKLAGEINFLNNEKQDLFYQIESYKNSMQNLQREYEYTKERLNKSYAEYDNLKRQFEENVHKFGQFYSTLENTNVKGLTFSEYNKQPTLVVQEVYDEHAKNRGLPTADLSSSESIESETENNAEHMSETIRNQKIRVAELERNLKSITDENERFKQALNELQKQNDELLKKSNEPENVYNEIETYFQRHLGSDWKSKIIV